ncbi:hypothetical protein SEUCBS139899_004894 [Sporothrix eucalyptigena]
MFTVRDQRSPWLITSKLETRKLLIAVNCLAGLSIFFFGYDQGMMGSVNDAKDYLETMKIGYIDTTTNTAVVANTLLQGGIMAAYYLGTLLGCLVGGAIGDRIGRIHTIAFGAAWSIMGASLQSAAQNSDWMICARVVNGIGTGVLNAIVPTWASELSHYASRGAFIAMEFTLNIFGVVVAYWVGYGVSYVDGGLTAFRWRFVVAFQIIPLLLLLAFVFFCPESPRWLCTVDREDEALYVLSRLRGGSGGADDEATIRVHGELQDMKDVMALERGSKTSYWSMFVGSKSADGADLHIERRVQLVIWLMIIQCWTGIAGITMYGPTIFSIAGFNASKSLWISGLNNIFYMFATLVCVVTIDRIGRRWTLYWGSVVQGIVMFLVGGLSRAGLNAKAAGEDTKAASFGAGAASMVFIYTSVFGATWLTVPWLVPTEYFPLHVRAKGNAWGVVGWSIGNGTLTLVLPYIVAAINEKIMYIFGAVNVLSIPVVWALYPESNQRTLEEINLLFAADTPWTWDGEKKFTQLKAENPGLAGGARGQVGKSVVAQQEAAEELEEVV